jgi:hypothetical protein
MGNDEMEQARKARKEYERHKVLKGVDKLNWDVCLYYINDTGELGIMRGTLEEVVEELYERTAIIHDIKITEVKLNELIKGLYEQQTDRK